MSFPSVVAILSALVFIAILLLECLVPETKIQNLNILLENTQKFIVADIPNILESVVKVLESVVKVLTANLLGSMVKFIESLAVTVFSLIGKAVSTAIFDAHNLFLLIFFVISMEFAVGWVLIRPEMKEMVRAVVDEGKIVCAPLPAAMANLWTVLSSPWRIIGYVMIIFLIRMDPKILEAD